MDDTSDILSDWKLVGGKKILKSFLSDNFSDALLFANKIGAIAERLNHHPSILVEWGRCTVESWTHDEGGVTEKDVILAHEIDTLQSASS